MDKLSIQSEALRCLDCKTKPCVSACPAHNNIPEFMNSIKKGLWEQARNIWHETSNLPELCGALCQNESLCEGACTLNKIHKPVRIGFVEKGVADIFKDIVDYPQQTISKKHLVIGLGPAGLANALKMAEYGFSVEAIDSNNQLGGTVYNLVPDFRFDKSVLNDIRRKFDALNIKIQFNTYVGRDVLLKDLIHKYDSIFIADGLGLPSSVDIKIDDVHVFYAQDLLNTNIYSMSDLKVLLGKRVYIIGLGNVAIDMARTLRRLDKEVHIVYRRTISDAPAGKSEIQHAIEEGIIIHELLGPIALRLQDKVKVLCCEETCLIKSPDGSRDLVQTIPNSDTSFEIDDLVFATGQKTSDVLFHGSDVIQTPDISPFSTNYPHIFVGGDRINKNKRIVDAMVTGLEVAERIAKGLYEIYR